LPHRRNLFSVRGLPDGHCVVNLPIIKTGSGVVAALCVVILERSGRLMSRGAACSEDLTIARRFGSRYRDTGKRLRVNDLIRVSPVRLIDENDEQIGVVDLDEAKQRARDADLDLVEVSPNTTPPVCRVMDYGKWKYHQKKKEQKARSHTKRSELKGIRLRPNIDIHDLNIKLDRAREFLSEGHKVQFTMIFRGRQMAHRNIAFQQMQDICKIMEAISKVETMPRMLGRRMTMLLTPDTTGKKAAPKAQAQPTPATPVATAPVPAAATEPPASS
jgi:translation initiation factor IF-3